MSTTILSIALTTVAAEALSLYQNVCDGLSRANMIFCYTRSSCCVQAALWAVVSEHRGLFPCIDGLIILLQGVVAYCAAIDCSSWEIAARLWLLQVHTHPMSCDWHDFCVTISRNWNCNFDEHFTRNWKPTKNFSSCFTDFLSFDFFKIRTQRAAIK